MHSPIRTPIPIETLLLAYRSGIFPMADKRSDEEVFWVEPRERAIIPLDQLHISRSLRKTLRSDRFAVTINTAFEDVIRACAAPREEQAESWISDRIVASYVQMHAAGHAHSVECWIDESATSDGRADGGERRLTLVGGLYGVSFDRVFCGESMFSVHDNASKIALCWLVALLQEAGYQLLDCQFMTDHLASMGAIEIPQARYIDCVAEARGTPSSSLADAYRSLVGEGAYAGSDSVSSPGKRIAQSLIQTS